MHYSGVVISAAMDRFAACTRSLEDLPGVEVHLQYPEQGKIVAVLETATVADQEDRFRRILAVPGVLAAELTYHYAEEGREAGAPLADRADAGAPLADSPVDPLPRREP